MAMIITFKMLYLHARIKKWFGSRIDSRRDFTHDFYRVAASNAASQEIIERSRLPHCDW